MTLPWTSRSADSLPCPGVSPLTSFETSPWRNGARSFPVTSIFPRSERSITPARSRTASCSAAGVAVAGRDEPAVGLGEARAEPLVGVVEREVARSWSARPVRLHYTGPASTARADHDCASATVWHVGSVGSDPELIV